MSRAFATGELRGFGGLLVSAAATATGRARRVGLWAIVVFALVLVGAAGALLADSGEWSERAPLDPESAGPDGARAIARVLVEQGVEVRVVRERDAVAEALGDDALLVLPDAPALSDRAITSLVDASNGVVLLEPRSRTLDLLLPGSSVGGAASTDPLSAACDAEAAAAGDIVAGGLYEPGPGVTACYPSDGGAALLEGDSGGRQVTAFDGLALLSNENIAQAGNAALALTVLGSRDAVVWYVPSLADSDIAGDASLGELTPPWVTPAIVLLLAAAIVAGLWRGRRFGPLVAENLPVTVRASETSVGRGRLYARSRDAAHAAVQLRRPVRTRIGALLGLGPHAAAETVADAAASRLGLDRASVRRILIDDAPVDDRGLVDLDHRLRDLESRVHLAVRPEGTPS